MTDRTPPEPDASAGGQRHTRRQFITVGGLSALWLATGCRADAPSLAPPSTTGTTLASPPSTALTTLPSPAATNDTDFSNRVLLLVQLLGGNDGLNTVVPTDGRYHDHRPTLGLEEETLLTVPGTADLGLHPSLAPLAPLFEEDQLTVLSGVGFEEQTRSHFQSQSVWWRASGTATEPGWLTRWITAAGIDQPSTPFEAIALGAGPVALAGSGMPAISDPANFGLSSPLDESATEDFLLALSQPSPGADSPLITAARQTLPDLLTVADAIGGDASDDRPVRRARPASLGTQLEVAADLIATRPELRVVTVGIGGFDTHGAQLATHSGLLDDVATSLADFWGGLTPSDKDRMLVLTTSEFGRRVAENGSDGTDHGRAGAQLAIGGGLSDSRSIATPDLDRLVDGDVPISLPAIDLYADALRWLGGPVDDVLGADPPSTGLLRV